ncbi:hypothetical protein [Saccharopolyspora hattusasensis]|uniref:hypothetical protein n=1 Tax=Saccharopolyspora hattusasensis TaxID=1128679 RepID=UPI003D967BE4
MSELDARRLVNAGLHRLHLGCGTVCVHAVGAEMEGAGVVLLGGHGAGKSLVGLALQERAWRITAGDVALVQVPSVDHGPRLLGGTAAYVVRVRPVARWFPALAGETGSGADKIDLGLAPSATPVPLRLAVAVDVDGDPRRAQGEVDSVARHTAVTVWLRASAHLLDRVLDDDRMVLREFENPRALRRRVSMVRDLAWQVPMVSVCGPPQVIAAHVHALMSRVPSMTGTGGGG